jgi:hypothetical protein
MKTFPGAGMKPETFRANRWIDFTPAEMGGRPAISFRLGARLCLDFPPPFDL